MIVQVRKFCLQYGASLFYTSVKEDKNCDLLYKYLVHRIYQFPFKVYRVYGTVRYCTAGLWIRSHFLRIQLFFSMRIRIQLSENSGMT